ncbi:MAG: undecaprenyl/decaprenyl-phosphate alpha-N-acetylglucosaminyl 1-phosphate transferase [Actinobacteria bacterium]|nr:undecaprenyl/decaprenyl-phosphate alpha-N-acetylglucosaminyl 1-phosphate transferase [Actinomycetota bacterium]
MIYILVFVVALALSLLMTPAARRAAVWLGAVDMPHDRKVHENPTPTLGGLAIFLAVVIALLVAKILASTSAAFARPLGMVDALSSAQLLGIILASTFIVLLGALDDMRHLSPWMKLAGQAMGALILVSFGVEITTIALPRGNVIDLTASPVLSILLTVAWTVAFTNIINLIDGLDGLAAGISFITVVAFFFYGSRVGADPNTLQAMVISAAVGGACLGFLRYNFNPASIFMGDSGAQFLGFVIGAISIQGILKRTAVATMFTPIIILAVPIADTGLAILRRARKGKPFHHADKEHIHHRLLYIGHSQRQAVLIIYLWTALLTGIALSLEFLASKTVILILLGVGVAVFLATTLPRIVAGSRELEESEEEELWGEEEEETGEF